MRTLSLLLLCCMALFHASGQPGSLDPSFGNKGIQTTAFTTNVNILNEQGRAVLTNTNGDIFVVLDIGSIVKYLPDGRLDSSYGNAGYSNPVNLDVAGAAFQGDKIIVAGTIFHFDLYGSPYNSFALARYKADGILDSSFGVNGKVTTNFFEIIYDRTNAIALQGNKIIVGGYTDAYSALARYTTNGTLDSSFGVNGLVTTNLVGGVNTITILEDKVIVAEDGWGDFTLARYTADGTLDSSFGVNGLVTTDFGHRFVRFM